MKVLKNRWVIGSILFAICIISATYLYSSHFGMTKQSADFFESEDEEREEAGFDKPDGFYNYFHLITTPIGEKNNSYPINHGYFEFEKSLKKLRNYKSAESQLNWVQRGPGNVGGRTRAVIIDPDDATYKTWIAASVSGGIWKTTDAGLSWTNLTNDLPYLATNTMAMANSNHDIIYVGTGEGYGGVGMVSGNGIYKTINRGQTWELIESTTNGLAFQFVNKLVVDMTNPDIVLAATNNGIFKTFDGGGTWDTVYYTGNAVQDLIANPLKSTTLYAAVNSFGIIKSFNNGDSWFDVNEGIGEGGRFSLTISAIDTSYVFTSVQAANSVTDLYISVDAAKNWRKMYDYDNTFYNFLGSQGWFNNVVKSHPFDKNKVYLGGVYVGLIEFKNSTNVSEEQVIRVDTLGTGSFLDFVNFGGSFLGGGMTTGLDEDADVTAEDFTGIEIRFGPGISQKAHRFTVPVGQGSGVPVNDYTYQNYVTVPFQVWDSRTNTQLMVSFRDQERDGAFNLIKRDENEDLSGREYIYVHAVPYSTSPNANIAVTGGHYYKMLYFFWPTLAKDKIWNAAALPVSNITVKYGTFSLQNASTTILADATRNENLHADHHDIQIKVLDPTAKTFMMVDANDGGLGLSYNGGSTWTQIKKGYITTQFYGVAKKPGANEFIGGMQDNGTWQSPVNANASVSSEYDFRVGGDGFEVLWHPWYPQRIIASSYTNYIKVSLDGGETWSDATSGIQGDGPFVTRLSNSPQNPNLVFAVGNTGVYRNTNFCVGRFGWDLIEIGDGWSVNDNVSDAHNVEVSLADPDIVWAGAGMYNDPNLHIFISKDKGLTFDSVPNFTSRKMGYISAIATHPSDTGTSYILFSMPDKPKIIRTTDFGQHWEDISGFGQDSSSSNGFPDVAVYSLLVLPNSQNTIWAGTEIGIFESTDNGVSWHYSNNGFPAVSVWQMFVQDNVLVVATHGRGIWTLPATELGVDPHVGSDDMVFNTYPNPSNGEFDINFTSNGTGPVDIVIYDMSGRVVHSEKILKNQLELIQHIDLTNLRSGNFILKLTFDKKLYSSKVIVR